MNVSKTSYRRLMFTEIDRIQVNTKRLKDVLEKSFESYECLKDV